MTCFKFLEDPFGGSDLMEMLGLSGTMEQPGDYFRYPVNKCGGQDYGENGG